MQPSLLPTDTNDASVLMLKKQNKNIHCFCSNVLFIICATTFGYFLTHVYTIYVFVF